MKFTPATGVTAALTVLSPEPRRARPGALAEPSVGRLRGLRPDRHIERAPVGRE